MPAVNHFETLPRVRLGPSESNWARRHLQTLLDSDDSEALEPFERELLYELADALGATRLDDRGATERTAAAASALIVGLVLAGRLRRPHARAVWDALCECGELPHAVRRYPLRLLPRDGAELH